MLRYLIPAVLACASLYGQGLNKDSYLLIRANSGLGSDWYLGPSAWQVDLQNDFYQASLAYGLGFSWQRDIGRQSMLELGLNYQRRSVISKEYINPVFPQNIDPYYGFVGETAGGGDFGPRKVVLASHYFEIPFRWNYFFKPNREQWYIVGGINVIHEFGSSSLNRFSDSFFSESIFWNASDEFRLQGQLMGAIAYRWALNGDWFLDAGLQAQHSFTPSRFNVPNQHYHWLVATEFSLVRKL